jgi:nucleolar pre-ribosomal-associated protein 1
MLICSLRFDWLFIRTTPTILENGANRDVLVDSLFMHSRALTDIQRAICLIAHSLASVRDQHYVQRGLLLLSASIVQTGRTTLSAADFASLKDYIFVQTKGIKQMLFSQSLDHPVREGQ